MDEWIKVLGGKLDQIHANRDSYVCRREIFSLVVNTVNLLFPSRCEELRKSPNRWAPIVAQRYDDLLLILRELEVKDPESQTRKFFESLPTIKADLDKDAEYFATQDPAAESTAEVILCYPGFLALIIHRLAHQLYSQNIQLLPRIMGEYAHERTGIDIHPGATLGNPIFIDHGTGIVIGETCRIGNEVKIFQGVTLGAPSVQRKLRGIQRHPIVGDRVILYANATILGGETHIGDDSIIGGNVWITESVAKGSRIYYDCPSSR